MGGLLALGQASALLRGAPARGEEGPPFALKVLAPGAGPERLDRFARERALLARLDHPHLLRALGDGRVEGGALDGAPYLVLPLLEGRSLEIALREGGRLPLGAALLVGRQLASALRHLHEEGFAHGDVSTLNVWLRAPRSEWDEEIHAILLDLGSATPIAARGATDPSVDGSFSATLDFAAPEQITGEHPLGPATDLYQLGCVAYAALTGAPPFAAPSDEALMMMHVLDDPRPPSARVSGVPPAIDQLVLALLAKEPGQRPSAAAAVERFGGLWTEPGRAS